MTTSQCQSLFGCTYPSFLFHVVGRSTQGTYQNKTEVGCVILMSKNVFSQLFHVGEIQLQNYTFIHKPSSTRAGGVGHYIQNCLNYIWKAIATH